MRLEHKLHALLFVAPGPATAGEMATALGIGVEEVEAGLRELEQSLDGEGPLRLVRLAGGYQLSTRPEFAPVIGAFLKPSANKLGRGMLEVLAIVAYRQPITVPEIEAIRGASAEYSVRGLLERRLIVEKGRRKAPGRPVEYATGTQFLHAFGLDGLHDLPPLAGDAMLALPAPLEEAGDDSVVQEPVT